MKPTTAMVILAAGASSRMQAIKQLLPWKKTTLLGNAIEQGLNSNAEEVYVILGANAEIIKDGISNYTVNIIENKNWQQGIGSAIACAINYLKIEQINYDAVLIALADQPLITVAYFNLLIEQYTTNQKRIIASNINNIPSVPAIFDAFYFEELATLNQDKGAKSIIKAASNDVFMVDAAINLVDVDTIEVYENVYNDCGKL